MFPTQLRWQCSSDFDAIARLEQGLIVNSVPETR